MITITLKQLNDSFESLNKVSESLTAGKMKYRFAKVLKTAKTEVEQLGETLAEIAKKHGASLLGGNRFEFDAEKQRDEAIRFNVEASHLMKSEIVKLDFDPKYFTFDELTKAEDSKKPISAADLANLLWLISDSEIDSETPPKTAAASA